MSKIKGNFSQFEMFVKISELGSLSKAARELGLTPSAVSRSLSLLESELGTNLVNRTTRVLTLTNSGKILLDKAQYLLNEVDDIFESVKEFNKPSGKLKLTSSLALGCSQLPHIISSFQEMYPEVNISLHLDDRIINLHEEEYDLALRVTNMSESSNYSIEKITDIHWLYYASFKYLSHSPAIDSPEDIVKHKCLVYPKMTSSGKWIFKEQHSDELLGKNITPHISCNSSLFLLQCVLMNEGIACLPNYLVSTHITNGKLKRVLDSYESGIKHSLYAVTIKRKIKNPIIKAFILHLKRNIKIS
ncbi:LysR family transcriptional regulator [Citrobacter telavivensis]